MKNLIIILTFICFTASAQQSVNAPMGVPMGNVMPGPKAVIGFIATKDSPNSFNMYKADVKQYDVYKDEKGNGNFKKVTSVTFPSSYAEFTKRIGIAAAMEIRNYFEVKTDEEAYTVLQNGDPKKIGFVFLSKEFLTAVGALWQDNDIKNNQLTTVYKLVKVSNTGKEETLFTQIMGDVPHLPFSRYQLQKLVNADSTVQVTWQSKTTNTPASYGRIFRKTNTETAFIPLDKSTLIYNDGDSSKTYFAESVKPGQLYQYYFIPEDMAGNQGLPSDTAFAVSKSFSKVKGITNFIIKDSLQGAWLSWKGLPREGIYTGIQILKSRKNNEGFIVVATVGAEDSTYLDKELLPNVVYHYQVRPLTISLKGFSLLPAATANIAVKGKNELPFSPQGLRVWQDSTAQIKLFWNINPEIDQFAYYVLRGTSKDDMRIISPALRTNIFTDSLKNLDGLTTYYYGVKLMNIDQKMSEISIPVLFKPLKLEFVAYPSGIGARYADQTVKLFWENMIEKNDDIVGYRVYRKAKTDKEFKLLNVQPITTVFYDDANIESGATYEYALTAINASLNQSILSPSTSVTIPLTDVLAPPADLYLLNKKEGIYISWPAHADNGIVNTIFRKSVSEKDFKLIAEVKTLDNFMDKTAQNGILYSYRIVTKNKNGASNPSIEKSIRRN